MGGRCMSVGTEMGVAVEGAIMKWDVVVQVF